MQSIRMNTHKIASSCIKLLWKNKFKIIGQYSENFNYQQTKTDTHRFGEFLGLLTKQTA